MVPPLYVTETVTIYWYWEGVVVQKEVNTEYNTLTMNLPHKLHSSTMNMT